MSPAYTLTSAAEADLRDVIRYTRSQWGSTQAREYVAKLADGIDRLVRNEGGRKDMSGLYPGLRMARCEHHYIFVLPRNDAPALVIAIFHERMELMVRLANRLG